MAMKHLTDSEIQAYLDGGASDERGRLDSHLKTCDSCRKKLREYEMLYDGLSSDTIPGLPADFTGSVMAELDNRESVEGRRPTRRILVWLAGVLVGLWAVSLFVDFTQILRFTYANTMLSYFKLIISKNADFLIREFDIDLTTLVGVGLILIVTAALDRIIRRWRHRPITFVI
jgi:hypothetical protein